MQYDYLIVGSGLFIFGGRLAEYKYDMAPIIEKVMGLWKTDKMQTL